MAQSKKTQNKKNSKAASESQSGDQAFDLFGDYFPESLPVLPAKDIVAFPSVMMSLYVGRPASVEAVEQAMAGEKLIFIVAQSNLDTEDPVGKDLYKLGVVANVVRSIRLPDGRQKVLIQGLGRAEAKKYMITDSYVSAQVKPIAVNNDIEISAEIEGILNRISENLQVLVEYEHLPEEMLLVSEEAHDAGTLADIILAHYKLPPNVAQKALEEKGVTVKNASLQRIPLNTTSLSSAEEAEVVKVIELLEEDEDVQHVYHTLQLS